ncbi:MAG: Tn3 family transposase [Solirubrobacteraceae bacterium]
MTAAEVIALEAARYGRRGPPEDYGRFPERLSADELAEFFFFDERDRELICKRRRECNRLGFAAQLGTVRYLGRFLEDPCTVSEQVVRWVGRELGVDPSGLGAYARGEARWDHQAEIRREYGYREFHEPDVERELVRWLEARAWVSAESHRALFDRSVDHLIASKVLLPGASVLWRLVGTVCHRAAERGYELIARGVTADERLGLERALRVREGSSETQLEWLRHGPVKPTAEGMVLSLGWLRELRVLSPALTAVDELPAARLRALLVDARTARAQQIAQMGDARRVATLTAFAAIGELRAQDQTLDHLDVILSEIDSRATARERKRRLEIAGLIDQAGVRLADACALVLDESINDADLRDAILAQVGRGRLQEAISQLREHTRPVEEGHRERLLGSYGTVRRFLPLLLDTLHFQATDAGEHVLEAIRALREIDSKHSLTQADVPMGIVTRAWRRLVLSDPGKINRSAYTFCALEALRDALHRRDVFVARSDRWGDPRSVLLPERAWEISREQTRTSLKLPTDPKEFVAILGTELDAAYQRTLDGLRRDHPIFEVAEGRIDLEKLDALDEPASLRALRARIDAMLPDVELPELLLEIATRTRFTTAFTHEREPSARLSDLEVSVIAVLIAHACNVGYKPLVDEKVSALRLERLKYVARHYIRPETLIAANAMIVDYHTKLPLAIEWGGGEVANIDGLRFVVPRATIHARRNPRYFHRRRGLTAIGTTADHYVGIHTIVVPGTPRDGLYLLDGLLDPQTSVRPQQIMTDTAGYSDIMFGCYRILDFQLSPRMADSGGARFWKLDPLADYGRLNAIATNVIDRGVIELCYDDILRVGGSLLQRQTTGSELMRALRSHTRHLATLGRALAAVGRVPKTIHLLDYCNDPIYRRAILGQINRGEGRHELARRVCHGNKGELAQPYQRGQEEQIGALGLVVNCIVLYNTIYTQRALDQLTAAGYEIQREDIRRLSPLGHEHITLTGRYHIALTETIRRGEYRPLKTPDLAELASA